MDSIYQKLNKKLDTLQEHKSHNKYNKETMKYTFQTLLVTLTQLNKGVYIIYIYIYIERERERESLLWNIFAY
jgi:hypothetical protein